MAAAALLMAAVAPLRAAQAAQTTQSPAAGAPAFDVVSSMSGLGYQALLVGRDGADSTLDNALSETAAFGLRLPAAKAIVREVAQTVDGWKDHFQACGASDADLTVLAQYLDNDRLGAQRKAHAIAPMTAAR